MSLEVILNDDNISIDTGYQYITLSIEEAKNLVKQLEDKLYVKQVEKNQDEDYKYMGGL